MEIGNCYNILGVRENASQDEIELAYNRLILKYDPDIVPEAQKREAEEILNEISLAYYIASDSKLRLKDLRHMFVLP